MALMEISVCPLGTGSPGLGSYIAEMQRLLSALELPHELTDMGTTVQGDMDQLLAVIKTLHESPFSMGVQRVYTVIKIDDRRDRTARLGDKIRSVKERL